jgi:hypothetical protein
VSILNISVSTRRFLAESSWWWETSLDIDGLKTNKLNGIPLISKTNPAADDPAPPN